MPPASCPPRPSSFDAAHPRRPPSPGGLAVMVGLALAPLGLVTVGCAAGPRARTREALPLRSVVLHRNGVGYFERAGRFEGDELVFQVRRRDVGDFLASLAAVERGAGRVDSVSFEVDDDSDGGRGPGGPGPLPEDGAEGASGRARDPGDDLVDVRLRFSDRRHDLRVSYVVGAPIWKPTYRVVLTDGPDGDSGSTPGRALLQAWAVVQNVTGEDWDGVRLSLTTGTPIAFESDLATPVTPARPRVSDQGDVVGAVPEAEVAYGAPGDDADDQTAQDAVTEAQDGSRLDRLGTLGLGAGGRGAAPGSAPASRSRRALPQARDEAPPPPGPAGVDAQGLGGSVSVAARMTRVSDGITRYDLDGRLTVPDGGSTMVAVVSQEVPGEAAHLFAPEPGVPDSVRHPFRVARLTNGTGAALERGPLTIYGAGGFLGQGVLSPMPDGASTFVPFALDRTLAVERREEYADGGARLVRIVDGRVTVDGYRARRTRYQIRNGGGDAAKVYLQHAVRGDAELHEPPEGTETVAAGVLVPARVGPQDEREVVVEERSPVRRTVDAMSPLFAEAVAVYLEGGDLDEDVAPALRQAIAYQEQLAEVRVGLREKERARREVRQAASEARESLEALRRVEGAGDLRARLVRRLEDADERDDALTREIVELQTRESELRVRLRESLSEVTLD